MGKIIRTISADGGIMCCVVDTTDAVYRAEQIHKTSAVITAALGRMLTAASLMGIQLKGESDSVTLRMAGNGPSGSIITVSDSGGNVRGYCENTVVELPLNQYGKLDVSGAVGKEGTLSIIKDIGLKDPYIGQVPIVSGEIAEDITNYYATSEQIPTVCALGVLVAPDLTVRAAGGYLVQLLPGADEACIDRLEENTNALDSVSTMLDHGMTPQEIAFAVLNGFEPAVLDEYGMEYRCNCSKQRVEKALISIGEKDLRELADEQEITEVDCHFCNQKYRFTSQELLTLLESALQRE